MGVGGLEGVNHKVLGKEYEVLHFLCKKRWNGSEILVTELLARVLMPCKIRVGVIHAGSSITDPREW